MGEVTEKGVEVRDDKGKGLGDGEASGRCILVRTKSTIVSSAFTSGLPIVSLVYVCASGCSCVCGSVECSISIWYLPNKCV